MQQDKTEKHIELVVSDAQGKAVENDQRSEGPVSADSSNLLQEKRTAAAQSYESDYVVLQVQSVLKRCLDSGRKSEAELLSRLLIDLHEGNIDSKEAEKIAARIAAGLTVMPAKYGKPNGIDMFLKIVIPVVFCALMVICVAKLGLFNLAPPMRPPGLTDPGPAATDPGSLPPQMVSKGWKYYLTQPKDQSDLFSQDTRVKTNFTLINSTSGKVSVYWLDYDGQPVHYMTLFPGQRFLQGTFAHHPWVVKDATGKPILWFLPGAKTPEEIDLANHLK